MWFTISAHDPDFEPGTRRNLDEIARHLAPSQITEAKSLAQQCLQTGYVDCTQASQGRPSFYDVRCNSIVSDARAAEDRSRNILCAG